MEPLNPGRGNHGLNEAQLPFGSRVVSAIGLVGCKWLVCVCALLAVETLLNYECNMSYQHVITFSDQKCDLLLKAPPGRTRNKVRGKTHFISCPL